LSDLASVSLAAMDQPLMLIGRLID
jgi:hypothetical protein